MKKFILLIILLGIIFVPPGLCSESSDLTPKEKHIVNIASYTARGEQTKLEKEFNNALNDKLKIYEIKEILVQLYVYCGLPRSINALTTFIKVTDERSANGGYDEYGNEPVILPADSNKIEIGTAIQTELCGGPVTGRIFEFEPSIDRYVKEHYFADIFSRGVLSYEEREIVTIAALSSMSGVEPQLQAHIQIARNLGVTQEKIQNILNITNKKEFKNNIFARGSKNEAYAPVFLGTSYLNVLNRDNPIIANVTFEPGCRNNWHIHHKSGQILLVTQGEGYYQEWGKDAVKLHSGMVVNIPAEVKHWHGATKDSWFVHIVIDMPAKDSYTEWFEPVTDDEYNKLP